MTQTAANGVCKIGAITNGHFPLIKPYINGGSRPEEISRNTITNTEKADSNQEWHVLTKRLSKELYSENITANVLRDPPESYPELVPQSGEKEGEYRCRPIDFWTCGFFPGSIYALLERATKHPKSMHHADNRLLLSQVRDTLGLLGVKWSEPLHRMAHRTDTHDLGFMIMPHMRARWELFHDQKALDSIRTAAVSLYSRFDARVGAIRSWDHLTWQRGVDIRDKQENFLVIIDSLCNLDLLFYAAEHTGYEFLSAAAVIHAKKLIKSHLRKESVTRNSYNGDLYSTCHVANFQPSTGEVKEIRTAQGYAPDSTWSRGQAWAILGYAQTYNWTGDEVFLEAACGLAEYFLLRLENAPACVEIDLASGANDEAKAGRYVPLWDFDAPIEDPSSPLRDVSAGVVAANGLLLLSQTLTSLGRHDQAKDYMKNALRIVDDTIRLTLSKERVRLESVPNGLASAAACEPNQKVFEAILRSSTVTWNDQSRSASADHGLVYADYYLIEFGNKLLQLGYASL
ncbi:glycoside hydrolase family 88 protein [Aaosphaeria arxii CBS 175.79]|uniref:Glycoside hydrolase family 88 protein n=1 Tax=Aaosphaeria arxii CBS 175.79 TaxID=1450172 RepID=A0A6A5XIS1_9PLEO|nr:glycoside hydrolase family 88 protein [Aaosphaeria arxii CBS 175.79]KAF2013158.1 glycoside hydrolase family 88 protein [Aaosphaeria arxii CBS 175.79]